MGWKIKPKYEGKKIGVRGFGLLDLSTFKAETIHRLSLREEFHNFIKYIEKDEPQKESIKRKRKTKQESK